MTSNQVLAYVIRSAFTAPPSDAQKRLHTIHPMAFSVVSYTNVVHKITLIYTDIPS